MLSSVAMIRGLNDAYLRVAKSSSTQELTEGLWEDDEVRKEADAVVRSAVGCTYPQVVRYQLPTPFYGRGQDGDYFGIMTDTQNAPQAGMVKIRMQISPNITWWKQMDVLDCSGLLLARDWTQDNKRSTIDFSFQSAEIQGASLLLWKAKAFGIHTPMYQMQHLEKADGHAWVMYWGSDG